MIQIDEWLTAEPEADDVDVLCDCVLQEGKR